MPMNHRILRPLARPLLLDAVPGAAAAYSLRQLSNSYTGPVVTVRRSSDDAEADFKASEIDDGTLAAFCGAGDGFVKTWFDQSGNTGRDASNTTAAQQPKIVDSGSLVTESGKAALEFDGSDDRLQTAAFSSAITQPVTSFTIASLSSLADVAQVLYDGRTTLFLHRLSSGNFSFTAQSGFGFDYVSAQTGQSLHAVLFNTTSSKAFFMGADQGIGSVGTGTLDGLTIGNIRGVPSVIVGGFALLGTISELIIYPSDQTANRERIEGDIAWYY